MSLYSDRHEAGKKLANVLNEYKGNPEVVILALPRGGMPVAYEVAKILQLPLVVFVVRKLGVPYNKELAMGALASGGVIVINQPLIARLGITDNALQEVINKEIIELNRRTLLYQGMKDFPNLTNKIILLIDDGLATGSTVSAALQALQKLCPKKIIVAVPVGPVSTCAHLRQYADEVLCLAQPSPFYGVGQAYKDFTQTTDAEVLALLKDT